MLTPIKALSLENIPGLAHGFFTREGGISEGIYASLNCGLGSRDERTRVLENRRRVAQHLGASDTQLLTCHQIHSAQAQIVTRPWGPEANPKVDALVTATPGLAVAVLAADCAPILLADPDARVIGATHAGWRGALGGILEATIAAMERLGAKRERIRAALGPCIGPGAYEVGDGVRGQFPIRRPCQRPLLSPARAHRTRAFRLARLCHSSAGTGWARRHRARHAVHVFARCAFLQLPAHDPP